MNDNAAVQHIDRCGDRPGRCGRRPGVGVVKELATDVAVPFQSYFAAAMRNGRKRVTSRPRRFADVGQTFVAFECRFLILGVHKRPLSWVREYLWRVEGCESPGAFIRVWVNIHKRAGWTPARQVWVHAFERIE